MPGGAGARINRLGSSELTGVLAARLGAVRLRVAMGHRQPLDELLPGFVGRPAVEGHQSPRSAGHSGDLRPPLVETHAGNLDSVLPAIDGFFEPMHRHCALPPSKDVCETSCIVAAHRRGSSERTCEGASTECRAPSLRPHERKIIRHAPRVHSGSTHLPQLFHNLSRQSTQVSLLDRTRGGH